jgi:hypothetical protein
LEGRYRRKKRNLDAQENRSRRKLVKDKKFLCNNSCE